MDSVNSVAPPAASGMAGGGGSMGGAGPEQAAQFQNAMATPAETTSGQSAGSNGWNAGAGDVSQSGMMAGGATGQVGQSMLQMPNTDSASSGSMSQMPNTDSASSGSMPQMQNPDSAPSTDQNSSSAHLERFENTLKEHQSNGVKFTPEQQEFVDLYREALSLNGDGASELLGGRDPGESAGDFNAKLGNFIANNGQSADGGNEAAADAGAQADAGGGARGAAAGVAADPAMTDGAGGQGGQSTPQIQNPDSSPSPDQNSNSAHLERFENTLKEHQSTGLKFTPEQQEFVDLYREALSLNGDGASELLGGRDPGEGIGDFNAKLENFIANNGQSADGGNEAAADAGAQADAGGGTIGAAPGAAADPAMTDGAGDQSGQSTPQMQNPDSAPSPEQNAGTQADTATGDGSAAAAGVVNGDLNGDGRYSKDEFIADVARYNEIQGILSSSGAQGSVISPEIQEELNPLLSRLASIDVTDFIGDKTVDLSRFA